MLCTTISGWLCGTCMPVSIDTLHMMMCLSTVTLIIIIVSIIPVHHQIMSPLYTDNLPTTYPDYIINDFFTSSPISAFYPCTASHRSATILSQSCTISSIWWISPIEQWDDTILPPRWKTAEGHLQIFLIDVFNLVPNNIYSLTANNSYIQHTLFLIQEVVKFEFLPLHRPEITYLNIQLVGAFKLDDLWGHLQSRAYRI